MSDQAQPPASTLVIPAAVVPFPTSVTITNSSNGVQPTISWKVPNGYTPNAFRVNIFDRSSPPLANGQSNIIYSTIVAPTATSFTIPPVQNDEVLASFQIS